jgi:hypothetical protein
MTQEALKLAFEKVTGIPDAWTNPALMQARNGFIQGWEASLSQMPQEPVAWVDPATLYQLKIGLEGVHLVYETEMVNSLPLYEKPQGWRDNVAQAYLKGFDEGERRYRWLRKEYAESRETYLAECVPSENALDEYIDRQMAKTSIKTERWSGK